MCGICILCNIREKLYLAFYVFEKMYHFGLIKISQICMVSLYQVPQPIIKKVKWWCAISCDARILNKNWYWHRALGTNNIEMGYLLLKALQESTSRQNMTKMQITLGDNKFDSLFIDKFQLGSICCSLYKLVKYNGLEKSI